MFVVYLVVALIGLAVVIVVLSQVLQGDNDQAPDALYVAALGAVGFIYAVFQLLRPAPLPDPTPGEAPQDFLGPADW